MSLLGFAVTGAVVAAVTGVWYQACQCHASRKHKSDIALPAAQPLYVRHCVVEVTGLGHCRVADGAVAFGHSCLMWKVGL